jgi:ssRNA-specific RNase YbeY (16S rRNA maturation enzyme)
MGLLRSIEICGSFVRRQTAEQNEEMLKSHMSFALMFGCLHQYCYESSLRDLLLGKREESGLTRAVNDH